MSNDPQNKTGITEEQLQAFRNFYLEEAPAFIEAFSTRHPEPSAEEIERLNAESDAEIALIAWMQEQEE